MGDPAQSPSCDYGQQQTMNHIVDTCPLTKFECRLNLLHEADDCTVIWWESTATVAHTHTREKIGHIYWVYRGIQRWTVTDSAENIFENNCSVFFS